MKMGQLLIWTWSTTSSNLKSNNRSRSTTSSVHINTTLVLSTQPYNFLNINTLIYLCYYDTGTEWSLLQPVLLRFFLLNIYDGCNKGVVAFLHDFLNMKKWKNRNFFKLMRHYLESAKLEKIKLFLKQKSKVIHIKHVTL